MTHDTQAVPSKPSGSKMLGCGVIVLFTLLAILLVYMTWPEKKDDTGTNNTITTRVVGGKTMQPYFFANYADGCITVELRSDAWFYPKGGKIMIYPPSGEPWEDVPGVASTKNNTNQPPGWYKVCRKDPGAWGVEIWN